MSSEEATRTMLEARSVAVIGASPKADSLGEMMMIELMRSGYDGAVYPVNPKYDEIRGFKAYPSVTEIPEPVDLAILGVGNHLIEAQMQAAADAGARSVAIFASLYDPETGGQHALQERLGAIAAKHDMAVCGGNCMGFLNVDKKLRACGFFEPDRPSGPITFISHSGSVFAAMTWNRRDLDFNLVVSPGQEIATTTSDYMHYALEQPTTRAIGLFIETIRDPDNFKSALIKAAERDIPVVALKVGRVAKAREMVAAHSGALAGEDGAYEALFEAYGVQRVEDLDSMCDSLELFSRSGRRAGPGGFASIHDSGGERAMIVDAADEAGVRFAEISESTVKVLEEHLDEGLPPVNPLDAWGTGNEADRIFIECQRALHDDPDTAALAFAVDLNFEEGGDDGFVTLAKKVWPHTTKPYALLSNMGSTIHQASAKELRSVGIPVLKGTNTGLLAFRRLFEYRDFHALPPLSDPVYPADDVRAKWRARLTLGGSLGELEGLELISDYGVPVIRTVQVDSVEAAEEAAEAAGYPVAMKTAAPGIQHKSDAGGVKLGLRDADEVREAYADLSSRLGPEAVVAPMAPKGVELALGIVRDPQFGSLVLVAAGGILVELLKDRRMGVPPLDEPRARRLVDGLKSRALLDGVRGAPASDVDAIVRAVVSLSALADDLGGHIAALDVNPIIAGPDGCVAVDALVIPS